MSNENEEVFKAESKIVKLPNPIGRIFVHASKLKPRTENEILSIDDLPGDRDELFNSVSEHGYRVPLIVEGSETKLDGKAKEHNKTLEFSVISGHRRLSVANDSVASEDMKWLPCIIYPPLTPEQRDELDSLSNNYRTPSPWQAAVRWYRLKKANSSRLNSQTGVEEEIGRQLPKLQAIAKISGATDTMKKTITVIREVEKLISDNKERALEIKDKAIRDGWMAAYRMIRPPAAAELAQEMQSDQSVTPVTLSNYSEEVDAIAANDIKHEPEASCENEVGLPENELKAAVDSVDRLSQEQPQRIENIPEIVSASAPPDAGRNMKTIKDGLRALSRVLDNLEKAGVAVEPHKQHRMDIEDFLVRSYKELGWK